MIFKCVLFSFLLSISLYSQEITEAQNLTDALEIANQEDKFVLLIFQGSDWCGPCKILDKNVWQSTEFQTYAKDNLVLIRADFPRKKKNQLNKKQKEHNQELAEKFNSQGMFPLVVALNSNGTLLGKTGYKKMNATEYINHIKNIVKN